MQAKMKRKKLYLNKSGFELPVASRYWNTLRCLSRVTRARLESAFHSPFRILDKKSGTFLAINFEDFDDVEQVPAYCVACGRLWIGCNLDA